MKEEIDSQAINSKIKDEIASWDAILIQAARDLAYLTPYGINAAYISQLAHKCEEFEKLFRSESKAEEQRILKREIQRGINKIHILSQKIWKDKEENTRIYQLELSENETVYQKV